MVTAVAQRFLQLCFFLFHTALRPVPQFGFIWHHCAIFILLSQNISKSFSLFICLASFLFVKKYLFLVFQRRESLLSVTLPGSSRAQCLKNRWVQSLVQLNNLSSIHPTIYLSICPSIITIHPSSIHPLIHPSIITIHPSIRPLSPFIHPSSPSIHPFTHSSIHPFDTYLCHSLWGHRLDWCEPCLYPPVLSGDSVYASELSGECNLLGSVSSQQNLEATDVKALGLSHLSDSVIALGQISVTALCYSSVLFRE